MADTSSHPSEPEEVEQADSTAQFEPLVQLEVVQTETGEEEEDQLLCIRCRLYRFSEDSKEWKERGTGDMRVMKHKTTNKIRLILRQEKTMHLRLNCFVQPNTLLSANMGSDRSWTFPCKDFSSDPPVVGTVAVKFKNADAAGEFKEAYDAARENNRSALGEGAADAPVVGGTAPPAAPAPAPAATPAATPSTPDTKQDAASPATTPSFSFASPPAAEPTAAREEAKSKPKGRPSPWVSILKNKPFDPLSKDDVKALWTKYDADGSNFLDRAEVKSLLVDLFDSICKVFKTPPADEVKLKQIIANALPGLIDKMFVDLDKNKDGKLSWEEFRDVDDIKLVFGGL